MNDKEIRIILVSFALVCASFVAGVWLSVSICDNSWKRTVVKRGHAIWAVNDDGEISFQWKEAQP